jgi:hypothetical protein
VNAVIRIIVWMKGVGQSDLSVASSVQSEIMCRAAIKRTQLPKALLSKEG